MATRRTKKKPSPGQFPSQTYEARAARGRRLVTLSLPVEDVETLDALAADTGESRSALVARLGREEKARKQG